MHYFGLHCLNSCQGKKTLMIKGAFSVWMLGFELCDFKRKIKVFEVQTWNVWKMYDVSQFLFTFGRRSSSLLRRDINLCSCFNSHWGSSPIQFDSNLMFHSLARYKIPVISYMLRCILMCTVNLHYSIFIVPMCLLYCLGRSRQDAMMHWKKGI